MKFKPVYKCQRCGVVFEGGKVRDLETFCESLNPSHVHEHICGPNEHGVGHPVGFNRIDEEAETLSVGKSLLEKQCDHLEFQKEFLRQVKSVSENAKGNPYWLLVCSEDEVLGVIGDAKGLSLNLDKEGIIEFRDLPLECSVKRSGKVSKVLLAQVFGDGPSIDMKAGTYAEYERQIAEYGFSDIVAKLACVYLQAGHPFRISTGKIGAYTCFT